jgi:hypothetical protein
MKNVNQEYTFYLQVTIDGDQTEQLIKLLDSVVIMLEGGTEFDLQVWFCTPINNTLAHSDLE